MMIEYPNKTNMREVRARPDGKGGGRSGRPGASRSLAPKRQTVWATWPGNMVGNLVKRSLGKHNYNTNWKRRYFVMDRTSITYYNDSSLKSLKKPKVLCFLPLALARLGVIIVFSTGGVPSDTIVLCNSWEHKEPCPASCNGDSQASG